MARARRSLGTICLAITLILYGLVQLVGLSFAGLHYVLGGLAIAAGVLLLLNK